MYDVDQSKLSSDCFLIQFEGLTACDHCPAFGTRDCGGKAIRKKMLAGKTEPAGRKIKPATKE